MFNKSARRFSIPFCTNNVCRKCRKEVIIHKKRHRIKTRESKSKSAYCEFHSKHYCEKCTNKIVNGLESCDSPFQPVNHHTSCGECFQITEKYNEEKKKRAKKSADDASAVENTKPPTKKEFECMSLLDQCTIYFVRHPHLILELVHVDPPVRVWDLILKCIPTQKTFLLELPETLKQFQKESAVYRVLGAVFEVFSIDKNGTTDRGRDNNNNNNNNNNNGFSTDYYYNH